jgi:uncharacterized protein
MEQDEHQTKNPGNFANNPQRAAAAGRKGGRVSGGNFANNPQRAAEAGRKGGRSSHATRQDSDAPSPSDNPSDK